MKYESLNAKLDAKLAEYQAKQKLNTKAIAEKMFSASMAAEESRAAQEESDDYLPPVLFN